MLAKLLAFHQQKVFIAYNFEAFLNMIVTILYFKLFFIYDCKHSMHIKLDYTYIFLFQKVLLEKI